MLLCIFLIFGISNSAQTRHFGYSRESQRKWHVHGESCLGHWQSPIAIDSEKALPLAIPALETIGFDNLVPRPISMANNGHSVDIKPGRHFAKIFGALLKGTYEVQGIHFHWGKKNNRGSEHVINGMRFAMEMHIVTKNSLYANMSEALNFNNGIAVMAFFFDVREQDNAALEPILYEMNMIQPEGTRVYLSKSFTLNSLLPENRIMFYMYRGSLTTPPCSEVVTWIVFPDPQPISYSQMREFRQLSYEDESIADNYRHIQSLGNRKVYVRRYATETDSLQHLIPDFDSPEFWD